MKVSKFTVGLVGGLVLGVLFAPTNGNKSRKAIAKAAKKVNSTVKKWFGNDAKELDELKALLADENIKLTEADRKKLMQLIENNQQAIRELES